MSLRALEGRRIGIWGYGVEGREAARLLRDRAEIVLLVDELTDAARLRADAHDDGLDVVDVASVVAGTLDEIVRSPGISRHRSDVERLRSIGIESRCLTAHWLDDQPPESVVGITGTKGKSTTAALTADLLRAAGIDATHVGNVGLNPTAAGPADVYVLEVSSHQAADMLVSPRVGALTTLTEDHLSWHGDLATYRADKLRLFAHEQLEALVVGPTIDPAAPELALVGRRARVQFAATGPAVLRPDLDLTSTALAAPHMRANLDLAVRLAGTLTALGDAAIAAVASEFRGLPHRLEHVATIGGVDWIDDALGSNPTATLAALDAVANRPGRTILLLGGADRGINFDALATRLAGVADRVLVVLTGDVGARMRAPLLDAGANVVAVVDHEFPDAIDVAARVSRPGDVVLFSPGAPTPIGEGNYADRGARFRAAVTARVS